MKQYFDTILLFVTPDCSISTFTPFFQVETKTMPDSNVHRGDSELGGCQNHSFYHNVIYFTLFCDFGLAFYFTISLLTKCMKCLNLDSVGLYNRYYLHLDSVSI